MIPKKLIKLSKNMRVDTITRQNKKSFAPLCFGDTQSKEEQSVQPSTSVKRASNTSSAKGNRSATKRKTNRRKEKRAPKPNRPPHKAPTYTATIR